MGKLSSIAITILMINIIGYLLMAAAIEDGFAINNPFGSNQTFIGRLYTTTDYDGASLYVLDTGGGENTLFGSVPQQPPQSFVENVGQFIDRIFVIFDFIRVMLAVLIFPVALFLYLGLPYALAMLLIPPLTLAYIIGFFDLISGGSN